MKGDHGGDLLFSKDPPWIREAEEDGHDDDEWFFTSITRYDHLCMYSLSCRASSLAVSPDGTHLAVCGRVTTASSHSDGRQERVNELMVLALPDKLLSTSPRQEGLTAKRDFAFRAGARETSVEPFLQVGFVGSSRLLLALTAQSLTSWAVKEGTDLLQKTRSVLLDVGNPASGFCVGQAVVAAFGADKIWLVDIATLEKRCTWHYDDTSGALAEVAACPSELRMVSASGRVSRRSLVEDGEGSSGSKAGSKEEALLPPLADEGCAVRSSFCREKPTLVVSAFSGTVVVRDVTKDAAAATVARLDASDESGPDAAASQVSAVRWEEADRILTLSDDNLVRVLEFNERAGTLSPRFVHDGHRSSAAVSAFACHPTVERLSLSADARGNLHAWAFCRRDSAKASEACNGDGDFEPLKL